MFVPFGKAQNMAAVKKRQKKICRRALLLQQKL